MKKLKTSSAAKAACVYGIQHYSGKPFISYAYKDKVVRERWLSLEPYLNVLKELGGKL